MRWPSLVQEPWFAIHDPGEQGSAQGGALRAPARARGAHVHERTWHAAAAPNTTRCRQWIACPQAALQTTTAAWPDPDARAATTPMVKHTRSCWVSNGGKRSTYRPAAPKASNGGERPQGALLLQPRGLRRRTGGLAAQAPVRQTVCLTRSAGHALPSVAWPVFREGLYHRGERTRTSPPLPHR